MNKEFMGKLEAEGQLYLYDSFFDRIKEITIKPLLEEADRLLKKAQEELNWSDVQEYKLDNARSDERIWEFPGGGGDCVLVLSLDGTAEIKFNSPGSFAFDLETYKKLRHSFTDLYLTNVAQAGKKLKLLFGKGDWEFTKRILEIDLHGNVPGGKLNLLTHLLTEGTWTDNSPVAGSVAWSGVKVAYKGISYTITDGSTNQAYIWWDFSLSTTTFQTSNMKPALTDDDFIVAYNDSGTHILIWNATLIDGRVLRTGSVTADELTITDLADIVNLLTVAEGKILIGENVLGADLHGIRIVDEQTPAITRVEGGHLAPGIANYGLTVRDADGNVTVDLGKLAGAVTQKDLVIKLNVINPQYQVDVDAVLLKLDETTKVLTNVNLTVDITQSGANGLDTGLEAGDTWYSIWVIYNPTTDTVAGLLSTSVTSPTMPSGYTRKRRVGWVKNDPDWHFLSSRRIGDWLFWDDAINILTTTSPATVWTDVNCSSEVPPTSKMIIILFKVENNDGEGAFVWLRRNGAGADYFLGGESRIVTFDYTASTVRLPCDDNQVIEYKVYTGVDFLQLNAMGYYDPI